MYKLSMIVTPKNTKAFNVFMKYLVSRYPSGIVDSVIMAVNCHLVTVRNLQTEDLVFTVLNGITVNSVKITEYPDPMPDMYDCNGIFAEAEDSDDDEYFADYIPEYDDPDHPDYMG